MFRFIEKEMPIQQREFLNFILSMTTLSFFLISIILIYKSINPTITLFISTFFFYLTYKNNKIGLKQEKENKKENKKEK